VGPTGQEVKMGNFTGLLTILFIGLKLTGYIDWSWVWVLSPVWVHVVLAYTVIIIMFITALIARLCERR